ncbi:MAG TPA: DUF4190 domain-containing protein [Acidimicrobiales bacterium]|nr:DUF4190 domain-containing protein [Acidimicrobiales bacterium]
MSDVSQGPGWWQASDGKWYSPEQMPGTGAAQASAEPTGFVPEATESVPQPDYPGFASATDPATGGPPSGSPGAPPPGLGAPPLGPPPAPSYGPPPTAGYAYPAAGQAYGYTGVPKNNGLAIAAMVCSFFFWIYGLGAILGIVFGFIARSQIKKSNGTQRGEGMALAGIIIGFIGIVIGIILIIVVVVVVNNCNKTGSNCTITTTN